MTSNRGIIKGTRLLPHRNFNVMGATAFEFIARGAGVREVSDVIFNVG